MLYQYQIVRQLKLKEWAYLKLFELEYPLLIFIYSNSKFKVTFKTWHGLWMPGYQGSYQREWPSQCLTLHSPFCLFIRKMLNWMVILNTMESTNQNSIFQSISLILMKASNALPDGPFKFEERKFLIFVSGNPYY